MSQERRTAAKTISRRAAVATAAGAAALAIAPVGARSSRYHAPNLNFKRQAGELNAMYLYVPFMEAIIPKFEEETGIKVNTVSTYASNDEWWAKVNAGEKTDFLIGSTDWVQRGMAADLLAPIDLSKLTNLETLQPEFQENEVYQKDGASYAVPWTRVYYSLIYNTNEFTEAPTSWDVTWDEAYKGKISVMDQAYARVATTALYLGQDPLAPDDPDAIREALLEQKPLVPKYWSDFQNGMEIFLNEEAVVGQLTAGRTRMAMSQDGAVNWTVPEEGCVTFIDTFLISKDAENVEEAHQFIDFLIRPDNMAEEMGMMFYDTLSAEAAAELPEDVRAMFAVPEDANLVLTVDLPTDVRQMMDTLWEEVKLS
jgi:spermidine/putrescine transport system substrate-binding protein